MKAKAESRHELRLKPEDDPRQPMLLKVGQLVIDSRSQRGMTEERVNKLAEEWDWNLAETPTVTPMAGDEEHYNVVEAQHRVEGLRKRYGNEVMVWCIVLRPLESERRSKVATGIARGRKPHNAFEQWHLDLNAGDAQVVAIQQVLNELGLRLGGGVSASTIGAVSTIRSIARPLPPAEGATLIRRTLTTLRDAFPETDQNQRWHALLLRAVSEIYDTWPEAVDEKRFVNILGHRKLTNWLAEAEGLSGPARWQAVQAKMVSVYNSGRQKGRRLEW